MLITITNVPWFIYNENIYEDFQINKIEDLKRSL